MTHRILPLGLLLTLSAAAQQPADLAVADGVVRSLGRKMIFTTNLPNVGDIDDALVRPGRCFGIVRTRGLECEEMRRLLEKVTDGDYARIREAESMLPADKRTATLAEVFRAINASE